MRVLIQRVKMASVNINGNEERSIDEGLLVFLGIEDADTQEDIEYLTRKIINLRVFDDENGVMNKSVIETGGEILMISQFTLHASTKKGNRPSYIRAAKPDVAIPLYEAFIKQMTHELGKAIIKGEFGADMQVNLVNNGPVTIWMDSKNRE